MRAGDVIDGIAVGMAIGVAIVIGARALAHKEPELTRQACREEGERAVLMSDVDEHLYFLTVARNAYARKLGAKEEW